MSKYSVSKLKKIMTRLRDPKNGCLWDKKQTIETIIPHTIEEVYELAEEILKKNFTGIEEELGDLLFQIVYLSEIARERGKFDFDDVVKTISKKMIYRHPHVFENKKFLNLKEFTIFWEKSKNKKNGGLLDNIPRSYPAMIKANKIQKKVAEIGFEYKSDLEAIDKIIEEAKELKQELKNKKKNKNKINEELGDLIFATLDVSRKLKLNPELVLRKSNNKFAKRWKKIESIVNKEKKNIKNLTSEEFEHYWERVKYNK